MIEMRLLPFVKFLMSVRASEANRLGLVPDLLKNIGRIWLNITRSSSS